MEQRLNYYKASPAALKAMLALEAAVSGLGLDPVLVECVRLRASQINGCAYCVDVHATALREKGQSERRVFALSVWRETPFFSARERAALAWCESVTLLPQTHAPDSDYEELCRHFDERERVDLTLAIGTVNLWNRLAVSFRKSPPIENAAIAAGRSGS